jgi:hypothetical protein
MPTGLEDPDPSVSGDPVAVIDEFHAMWNTHHLDRVLSFFTDDAVIIMVRSPREAPASYRGKAAIQNFVRAYLARSHVHARSHHRVATNRLVWMSRVSADWLRRLGVDWIEWKAEAVIRGGKIAVSTVTLTSESVAKLDTTNL